MSGRMLVTGGAGFIGRHLVDCLLARGDTVRVLERPAASVDHLPLDRIELVRGDIRCRIPWPCRPLTSANSPPTCSPTAPRQPP